jgi:hypothetical protein
LEERSRAVAIALRRVGDQTAKPLAVAEIVSNRRSPSFPLPQGDALARGEYSLHMSEDHPPQLPPDFFAQPLSARPLEDFATCPRKFLLSFFTSREQERRFRGGSAALHQALRAAVLELWQRGGPAAVPPESLAELFTRHWDGSLCTDTLQEQQLQRQGLQFLHQYQAAEADSEATLLATDLRLTGDLDGQSFVAVADLVLRPPAGAPQVLRLVTSRSPLTAAQLVEDLSAGLLWLLAHEHFPGPEPPQVGTYDLRKNLFRQVTPTPEQADYLRRRLASEVARLRREQEFAPRKGTHCRWCRSKAVCPLWHS